MEMVTFWTLWLAMMTVVLVTGLYARHVELQKRLAAVSRLEGKVDLRPKNAGLHYDPYADLPPTVIEALRKREKSRRSSTTARPPGPA